MLNLTLKCFSYRHNACKSQASLLSNHTTDHVCSKERCQPHSYDPNAYATNEYYLN